LSDYSKGNLPPGGWAGYREIGITVMTPVTGPFSVATKEGEYELPAGWRGFIALDADGDPYPVVADTNGLPLSYERVA